MRVRHCAHWPLGLKHVQRIPVPPRQASQTNKCSWTLMQPAVHIMLWEPATEHTGRSSSSTHSAYVCARLLSGRPLGRKCFGFCRRGASLSHLLQCSDFCSCLLQGPLMGGH